jgi:undecaprenyl-diphosphatase
MRTGRQKAGLTGVPELRRSAPLAYHPAGRAPGSGGHLFLSRNLGGHVRDISTLLNEAARYRLALLAAACFMVHGAAAAGGPVEGIDAAEQLTLLDALALGVVEGVTEYLPVSSTGHLLLTQHLMGLTEPPEAKAAADAYAVIIQIGAILAVLGLYRERIGQILRGLAGKDPAGLRLAAMLLVAFLPAAVIGLTLDDFIKLRLFGPWPVAFGWLAGGLVILLARPKSEKEERPGRLRIEDMTWRRALTVGMVQVFAMWPGVSRSLATILGGTLAGLGIKAAVEFSFLLGLITLGAATSYEMLKSGPEVIAAYGFIYPAAGILCSFAAAWLSVKWLVAYLSRHSLAVFGYYRVALAALTAALLLAGAI